MRMILTALWNTLALFGGFGLVSFFWNCGLDLHHWYITALGLAIFLGSWKGWHMFLEARKYFFERSPHEYQLGRNDTNRLTN
jgi:hypothetical protein